MQTYTLHCENVYNAIGISACLKTFYILPIIQLSLWYIRTDNNTLIYMLCILCTLENKNGSNKFLGLLLEPLKITGLSSAYAG